MAFVPKMATQLTELNYELRAEVSSFLFSTFAFIFSLFFSSHNLLPHVSDNDLCLYICVHKFSGTSFSDMNFYTRNCLQIIQIF